MLRLSKKLLFAIEAVVDIAYNAGAAPVRSSDISERQGIPRRYLEQVLQVLVHRGILAGQRGPRGGYRLARERRHIAIGDIVRIVRELEGSVELGDGEKGSELGQAVVRPIWIQMQDDMMERLDSITVEDLCNQARQAGIRSQATPVVTDFSI